MVSDADSFHLGYPEHATGEDRALLLSALLLLDYMYFERGDAGSNKNQ
jgi:hypothetical protein